MIVRVLHFWLDNPCVCAFGACTHQSPPWERSRSCAPLTRLDRFFLLTEPIKAHYPVVGPAVRNLLSLLFLKGNLSIDQQQRSSCPCMKSWAESCAEIDLFGQNKVEGPSTINVHPNGRNLQLDAPKFAKLLGMGMLASAEHPLAVIGRYREYGFRLSWGF